MRSRALWVAALLSGCASGGACPECVTPEMTPRAAEVELEGQDGDLEEPETREVDAGFATCEARQVQASYEAPRILIVFDRSCSMRKRLDAPDVEGDGPEDTRTRWFAAREAVFSLLDTYGNRVQWGLMTFPNLFEGCGGPIDLAVPPAAETAEAIRARLLDPEIQPFDVCASGRQPNKTPTEVALESVLALDVMRAADRPSYAVLLTDGAPGCDSSTRDLAQVGQRLAEASIPTAVVGFQSGPFADTLEALADASGLPSPAGSYFRAEDGTELTQVLGSITAGSATCRFTLDAASTGAELFVSIDGTPLTAGIDYERDATGLSLVGDACERARRGDLASLSASLDCPSVECAPTEETCDGFDQDCDDLIDEGCELI